MTKETKKILIKVLIAILAITIFILAIIACNNVMEEKERRQAIEAKKQGIIAAMESWAKNEDYDGEYYKAMYGGYWSTITYPEIESKAVEIAKSLENSPCDFGYFIWRLDQHSYIKPSIQNILDNIELSFEDKITIHDNYSFYRYTFPQITQDEVETYIRENGSKKIHTTAGTGGFYDGKEYYFNKDYVGLEGSPLYDAQEITYFGDFKRDCEYGVKLNYYYKEEYYRRDYFYFKDTYINFDPRESDCYYSGKYLFGISDEEICIVDVTTKSRYLTIEK